MRFLMADIKRAFTEPAFLWCLLAGAAMGGFSLFAAALRTAGGPAGLTGASSGGLNGLVGELSAGGLNGLAGASSAEWFRSSQPVLLPFLAPFLAAAPYSTMNLLEEETGYGILLKEKLRQNGYEFRRFLANGLCGGAAVCIPAVLLWVACLVLGCGRGGYGTAEEIREIQSVLLKDFLFGFCFASLSYGLTFTTKKRYLPAASPQVFYFLFIYAFPHLGLADYYPPLLYSPWVLGGAGTGKAGAVFAALLAGGIGLTVYGAFRRIAAAARGSA